MRQISCPILLWIITTFRRNQSNTRKAKDDKKKSFFQLLRINIKKKFKKNITIDDFFLVQ